MAVVCVHGAVDFTTAPMLRAVLVDLLDDAPEVVVDLRGTTLLDGHSVGILVSTHQLARKHDCELSLREPHGRVLRVLEVTGVDKLCRIISDEAVDLGEDRTVEVLLRARRAPSVDAGDRDRLRELAIFAGYDLAARLARAYRGRGESVDDLIQVALVGLIKSVDGFKPDRGAAFGAYAVPTIRGEIKRHFRDKGWQIRVPRRMQELGLELPPAREELSQRLGRSPTVSELAVRLGVADHEVLEAMEAAHVYRTNSLSVGVGDDGVGRTPLSDLVGGPDVGYDLVEFRESLRGLVDRLPPRERRILALRFYGNMTQAQIAEQVGVSQMHVSRLLTDALGRLRHGLTTD